MPLASPSSRRRGLGAFETTIEVEQQQAAEATHEFEDFREYGISIHEPKFGKLDIEERFPFQSALYSQEVMTAEEVVVKKSTQVGMSAWGIRTALYAADVWGNTALYIFPTSTHVHNFSDQRITPLINDSAYLTRRIREKYVQQKKLKQIGTGWLDLRGSRSTEGAQSVDAEYLFFDEYDDLDPSNVPQIERRLSGARAAGRRPRVRRIGRPTLPNYGITKAYNSSDRRRWQVTCKKCKTDQFIDWSLNVRWTTRKGGEKIMRMGDDDFHDDKDVVRAWRVCSACEHEIDVGTGQWVATNPGSRVIGFHVQQLIVPNCDLMQLVENSRLTDQAQVQTFYNNDLGMEYSPKDQSLTREQIAAACSFGGPAVDMYSGSNPVTAGLDIASTRPLNLRVSEQLPDGRRRALYIGAPASFDEVIRLMHSYRITMLAVDANPERRSVQALASAFPGRVRLVEYTVLPRAPVFRFDPDRNMAIVQRTYAIDAMMDSIRSQRNMPLAEPGATYYEHLTNIHGQIEEDAKGRKVRVYISVGPDDYAHAEVYDLIATELWRMSQNVHRQEQEAQGQAVEHEDMGISRLRLDRGSMDYDPGFGGR